ncbi:MAG TPA: hypothetical protein VFP12_10995 [Allosphingosinicella sp.]|nr:hypothetical protein [Allosphingosinicella sp.]
MTVTAHPEPDLDQEKQRLELLKLRADINYSRRSLFVQISNTIIIGLVSVLALYLVQRPQLDQMRRNQVAAEKQQAISLLIAAQGISDKRDRAMVVRALSETWPEDRFLSVFADTNRTLADIHISSSAKPVPAAESEAECASIRTSSQRLRQDEARLAVSLKAEIENPLSRFRGYGPAANALATQRKLVEKQLAVLDARAETLGCQ